MRPRGIQLVIVLAVAVILAVGAILLFRPLAGGPAGNASSSATAGVGSGGQLRQVKLLLGFQPDVQFAPFYLAQQAGYFRDAGLDVTIDYTDDVLRLVASGQAQMGVADATDVMIARTSGIPIKYVSALYEYFPVALIGAPDKVPDDPSGLRGMRIGTPGRFGSSWIALLTLLRSGGLTADDVTIRDYPQFDQVDGLLNGDVDLITGFRANEPLRLKAQDFKTEMMLVGPQALPSPGLVASDDLLAKDPGLVRAVAQAVLEAQWKIAVHPSAGVDAAVKEVPAIGDDRQTATDVLKVSVDLWSMGKTDIRVDPGFVYPQVWQNGYATMRALGFIDGSVPVQDMYDVSVMGTP